MFVTLINGHEPYIVNVDQIVAIEGIEGGRACTVVLSNSGAKRIPLPAAKVLEIVTAAAEVPDWAEGSGSKRSKR